MAHIQRIQQLRHPGVLHNFDWPQDLANFARYNLIYGWNASGKTTISELFRALELKQPALGEVELIIDGQSVKGPSFPSTTLQVRVFNRGFVAASVFPVGGGDVPPIFVLGEESAEKQADVEVLKTEKPAAENVLEKAKSEKIEAEKAFQKYCTDTAKVIKDALRPNGSNPYNNYDTRRYKARAEGLLASDSKVAYSISDAARDRLVSQSRAIPKSRIEKVNCRLPNVEKYREAVSGLLEATVVSSAIDSLKADASLSSWVRQGLGIHLARSSGHCLFCEQPLPAERIPRLEAHFNDAYEKLLHQIEKQMSQLQSERQLVEQAVLPDQAKFYEDLVEEYDSAETVLRAANSAVAEFLGALIDELKKKQAQIFESREIVVSVPAVADGALENINAVIEKHNEACREFDVRVKDAREQLEADSIAGSIDDYVALKATVGEKEAATTRAQEDLDRLLRQIAKIEREIIQHRQPAEELNADLKSYLGHDELRLKIKDTGYIISRSDGPAHSLSEGERTALALLYFLKSLNDRRFDRASGVVVLDDPVSSLDANALYQAFGFIRHHVDDVGQIFILTHSFPFFRQVHQWFRHLPGQNRKDVASRPAGLYMLEATLVAGRRRSTIKALDPLLEKYESEYHYLFASIYRRAHCADNQGLEANYVFPNMARRLLETFLAFRQPDMAGDLRKKLQRIRFDDVKKTRMLRFMHTHSHADEIGEPAHDSFVLSGTQQALQDLLDLMENEDSSHYSAMASLVDLPSALARQ